MKPGRVVGGKYNKKYARQLMKGLRADGASINKVCRMWGICRTTYNRWVEIHPEFAEAHEYGQRDFICWWEDFALDVASGKIKGNAGVVIFGLKNAEGLGWKDKVEVDNSGDQQIHQIQISVLPAPSNKPLVIEHDE